MGSIVIRRLFGDQRGLWLLILASSVWRAVMNAGSPNEAFGRVEETQHTGYEPVVWPLKVMPAKTGGQRDANRCQIVHARQPITAEAHG